MHIVSAPAPFSDADIHTLWLASLVYHAYAYLIGILMCASVFVSVEHNKRICAVPRETCGDKAAVHKDIVACECKWSQKFVAADVHCIYV